MASGRFLSISISEDGKLSKLSVTAEYVYLKTIPHLDRDGLITGKPGLIYSRVCPTREELFGELQTIIEEWVQVGLVIRYMTDEGPALFFRGFSKNNNLPHYERERPSRFPAPPGYYRGEDGLYPLGTEPPAKKPKKPKPDPLPPTNGTGQVRIQDELLDSVQDELHSNTPNVDSEEEDQDQEEVVETRTAAATAKPPSKPRDVSDFVVAYERIWGLTVSSQSIGDEIKEWESKLPYDAWCYALQECTDTRNHGHWRYLRRILERLQREGYQSKNKTSVKESATIENFSLEDIVA